MKEGQILRSSQTRSSSHSMFSIIIESLVDLDPAATTIRRIVGMSLGSLLTRHRQRHWLGRQASHLQQRMRTM
jgi:hypothetical protein